MEILIIILGCLLFAMSIVVYVLYKQNKLLEQKLETVVNEKLLQLSLRTGFFEYTTHLLKGKDPNDYDVYVSVVYVTELEKYQNGYSKIRIDNINVVSGRSRDNFSYIKEGVTQKFKEVVETKEITWLEKDKDLTEVRKDKLERILKEQ